VANTTEPRLWINSTNAANRFEKKIGEYFRCPLYGPSVLFASGHGIEWLLVSVVYKQKSSVLKCWISVNDKQ
jgi:hypothetical protein